MPLHTRPLSSRLAYTSTFVLAALAVVAAPRVGTAATQSGPSSVEAHVTDQDADFAAMLAARSDARRRTLAQAFLRQHGDEAAASRLATAHAFVGAALWRASCSRAVDGLCVAVHAVAPDEGACLPALRDRLVPRPRRPKLAAAALAHLEQASWLSDVPAPADPDEAQAFRDAMGETLVRLADHDLEGMLGLAPPSDLPIDPPTRSDVEATSQALGDYATQLLTEAGALIEAYAEVKATLSPRWVLVAAARTGLVMETPAESFTTIALPTGMSDDTETAYCEELGESIDMMRRKAQEVYAWCVERADAHGLGGPAVESCRERLDVLEAAE